VAVQDILGHADLTTTRRYSHLAPTEHLDVVETIVVPEITSKNGSTGQKVVNEIVNGAKIGVNPGPEETKTARKSIDLRAVN